MGGFWHHAYLNAKAESPKRCTERHMAVPVGGHGGILGKRCSSDPVIIPFVQPLRREHLRKRGNLQLFACNGPRSRLNDVCAILPAVSKPASYEPLVTYISQSEVIPLTCDNLEGGCSSKPQGWRHNPLGADILVLPVRQYLDSRPVRGIAVQ